MTDRNKEDAALLREAAMLVESCADDSISERLRARADELDPPKPEPWMRVREAIETYPATKENPMTDERYYRAIARAANEGMVSLDRVREVIMRAYSLPTSIWRR